MFTHNTRAGHIIRLRKLEPTTNTQDADVLAECLDQYPLQNIYLLDALQRINGQRTVSAQTDQTQGEPSASCDCETPGAFWGAFVETSATAASANTNALSAPGQRQTRLEGVLLIESDGRAGYLAATESGHTDQSLARLGTFAASSGIRTLVGQRAHVQSATANLDSSRMRRPVWRVQSRRLYFYRADAERLVRCYDHPVRKATKDDVLDMVKLYRGYEFSRQDMTDAEIQQEILTAMGESGTYFVVEHSQNDLESNVETHRRFISAARIYPETDRAGLIGAARTLPEFRGRGIYLSIRTACFEHLFRQGKAGLGMFLDSNASMHRVIAKQGGTILGEWLIADLKRTPPLRRQIIPSRARQWALRLIQRLLGNQRSLAQSFDRTRTSNPILQEVLYKHLPYMLIRRNTRRTSVVRVGSDACPIRVRGQQYGQRQVIQCDRYGRQWHNREQQ